MVKIRLLKTGCKNKLSYRIVVTDVRNKRDGRVIETLGHFDPKTKPATIRIKKERVSFWLKRGAQSTDKVRQLIKENGKFA